MHDLVIRNAKIVDGSGGPAITGDIAVGGKIFLQKRHKQQSKLLEQHHGKAQ